MSNAVVALLQAKLTEDNGLTKDLAAALAQMEAALEEACQSENQRLQEDLLRVVTSGGKRLRPALTYLGYRIGREEAQRQPYDYPIVPLMEAVELVHTSSLVHDDIVDRASLRRSVPTINATSGDFAAVQAGDFLLSKAALSLKAYRGLELEKQFGQVARAMCLAEFLQIETANKWNEESLDHYFEQITNKTARFLSSTAALGGKVAGASDETIKTLETYGLNMGLAFQIRDDVLDFASDEGFGKKCGIDLERGLFTLPLILALTKEPDNETEKKRSEEARKKAVAEVKTQEDIAELLQFVKDSGALIQAQQLIQQYTTEALQTIKPFQDTAAGKALAVLTESLAVRVF